MNCCSVQFDLRLFSCGAPAELQIKGRPVFHFYPCYLTKAAAAVAERVFGSGFVSTRQVFHLKARPRLSKRFVSHLKQIVIIERSCLRAGHEEDTLMKSCSGGGFTGVLAGLLDKGVESKLIAGVV